MDQYEALKTPMSTIKPLSNMYWSDTLADQDSSMINYDYDEDSDFIYDKSDDEETSPGFCFPSPPSLPPRGIAPPRGGGDEGPPPPPPATSGIGGLFAGGMPSLKKAGGDITGRQIGEGELSPDLVPPHLLPSLREEEHHQRE